MLYLATSNSPSIDQAMRSGQLGRVCTPNGGVRARHGAWCADNGAFSDSWDSAKWWRWLQANAGDAGSCLFAALPDVVGDWDATLELSLPWAGQVKALGYPVAIVLQDGATVAAVPWEDIDAVFVGGTTAWKLGEAAREIVSAAKRRGKWAHMGRVNSERRLRYASHIGCDSADGTFLSFGPDVNLGKLAAWLRAVCDQGDLFPVAKL